jgi:hypothetical protein
VTENEKLNDILAQTDNPAVRRAPPDAPSAAVMINEALDKAEFKQWVVGANDNFRPAGPTVSSLPPAVYEFSADNAGLYIHKVRVITDDLIVLPDSANVRVLEGMAKFWASKDRYERHGLLYKRGILLWGPPGGGKTATLQLLMKQLVEAGGIVILSSQPNLTIVGLAAIRRIEPERNLIVIMEDVDETIQRYGEHELLALLDGESQIANVVNIATTNYPDRLGARIVNRPSRFDERILVDMPTAEAREVYLRKVAPQLKDVMLRQWVADTDKMSVAHLRELAAAVLCLDQDYEEVLERLRSMRVKPRETSGFSGGEVGFSGKANSVHQLGGSPANSRGY